MSDIQKDLINLGMFINSSLGFLCNTLNSNEIKYDKKIEEACNKYINDLMNFNIFIEIVDTQMIIKNQHNRCMLIVDYTKQNLDEVYTKQNLDEIKTI